VILFKSALLHPTPSSRRHVIRVDVPVPVVVIRLAFWTVTFIKTMMQTFDSNRSKLTARAIFKEIKNSDMSNQNYS